MDSSIEVRPATPADAGAISALITSLLHYRSPAPTAPPPAALLAQLQPESLAQAMVTGEARYHVACDGGATIGAVGVRHDRHLLHLFVAESHHRRGIGGALWRAAVADVLTRQPTIEMTVRSSIYAVEIYRRFGFAQSGPRVDGPVSFVPMVIQLRRAD